MNCGAICPPANPLPAPPNPLFFFYSLTDLALIELLGRLTKSLTHALAVCIHELIVVSPERNNEKKKFVCLRLRNEADSGWWLMSAIMIG